MKRYIRVLTSLLALLALLVSLPICAMAEDYDGSEPISGNVDTYTDTHSDVTEEGSATTNQGWIDTNMDTIGTNMGTIGTNMGTVEKNTSVKDEKFKTGFDINTGRINLNNGTVSTNGAMGSYYSGLVWKNQALKSENGSYQEGTGVVEKNYGCIITSGDENATTADSATVVDNYGYVYCNYGTIKDNEETSLIDINGYQGVIENNNAGVITKNLGIVKSNSGTITKNTLDTSSDGPGGDGPEGDGPEGDRPGGDVPGGDVPGGKAIVKNNTGVVEMNDGGTVENSSGGKVTVNLGTVINAEGGKLYEYAETVGGEKTVIREITDAGTYYGVPIEKGYAAEGEEAFPISGEDPSEVITVLKQVKFGESLSLSGLFTQEGYEVIGYTAWDDVAGDYVEVKATTYQATAPSILELIWGKIKEIVPPTPAPSAEPEYLPVATAVTIIPDTIEVGTELRVKNQKFKVVAMDDGSYLIATVGKLTNKDLSDMRAFLARYFTPEQMEALLGDPELLSQELVAKFFGGDGTHISFRVAMDIFQK